MPNASGCSNLPAGAFLCRLLRNRTCRGSPFGCPHHSMSTSNSPFLIATASTHLSFRADESLADGSTQRPKSGSISGRRTGANGRTSRPFRPGPLASRLPVRPLLPRAIVRLAFVFLYRARPREGRGSGLCSGGRQTCASAVPDRLRLAYVGCLTLQVIGLNSLFMGAHFGVFSLVYGESSESATWNIPDWAQNVTLAPSCE